MKRLHAFFSILLFAGLLFSSFSCARAEESFCLEGCPLGTSTHNTEIIGHILQLSNNPETKFADWVAYEITSETLGSKCARKWKRDPALDPAITLTPMDYKGVKVALASDRGHQAPLASLCGSPYQYEANYLSNITPQKSALNQGAWEHLEARERKLIRDNIAEAVYSITGPLYERHMPNLPYAHLKHVVPSAYWKIISVQKGPVIQTAAFIMDQETRRDTDFCQLSVGISEIESRAHLRFFPDMDKREREGLKQDIRQSSLLADLGC